MSSILHCVACGRAEGTGPEETGTTTFLGAKWCNHCAAIGKVGNDPFVAMPSPGRMVEGDVDAVDAWEDCYSATPKKRILKANARTEVQRMWRLWDGDKSNEAASKLIFFGWLRKHRPFFLTFRDSGDRWQTVHCWLIQYERDNRER